MHETKLRPEVADYVIDNSLMLLKQKLNQRLQEKGKGAFASSHEILGVITEEYLELIEAVKYKPFEINQAKAIDEKKERIIEEMLDIAVGCVFGMASINDCDWL